MTAFTIPEKKVNSYIPCSSRTVQRARLKGKGPKHVSMNGRIFYSEQSLIDWWEGKHESA